MTAFDLECHLRQALDALPDGALWVGYSGGLDSTVLLHALARLPQARARALAAIHVDHGLHAGSAAWAAQCQAACAALELPCRVARVRVDDAAGFGLEAAARRARYAAFAAHLPPDAILALAHHRDDQAETLLLRLLHGAGHEGLGGMRGWRRFASGWRWRPLLQVDRSQLADYASRHGLAWIEDPSNADRRHARNHLREAVMPALRARWPDAAARLAASAARLGDEAHLLRGQAAEALAQAQGVDPATLSVPALRSLPSALRRLVLGAWLDSLALPRPPPGVWPRVQPELLDAAADASPCLAWRGAELRRYRGTVYGMRPLPAVQTGWSIAWDGAQPLALPAGFGTLRLQPARLLGSWRVAPRRGGERLQQPGAMRELRTLLQDCGVPPWTRARLPLVFDAEGMLLAAGDLALAPPFAAALAAAGTRLAWEAPAATGVD